MPGMMRLLQLLIVVALVLLAIRAVRRMLAPPPAPGSGAPPRFEATGRCEKCGTFVPRRELDAAELCWSCRNAGAAPPAP